MSHRMEIKVPDIGNFSAVEIIEVLVKVGDRIAADTSLITVESDKASMDIPSPVGGTVAEIRVKVGDKVSEGSPILSIEADDATKPAPSREPAPAAAPGAAPVVTAFVPPTSDQAAAVPAPTRPVPDVPQAIAPKGRPDPVAAHPGFDASKPAHASPSVRRFARELGAHLGPIKGSGPRGRITKTDVQAWIKAELGKPAHVSTGMPFAIPPIPVVDFALYGEIDTQPLPRIRKLSAANLHRNWVSVPHVTQFDAADITDLETFRASMQDDAAKRGVKLTLLAFLMKAAVNALRAYPQFNASLSAESDSLILKKYFHIGFACDTPDGLVVPVVRDVNQKDVLDIARDLADLSNRARERKLKVDEMQGGCFTISSLGGIGGTAFTPIINCPEVAILGVSRGRHEPVYDPATQGFVPRLMLPLSLSYDHRVIDGADGARFTSHLRQMLSDVRRLLL